MKLSCPATQSFNVWDKETERGLWIFSLLPLISSGSATNESLKFMPPLDEKGLEEKKETDSPWRSDVREVKECKGVREREEGSLRRRMTFELLHLKLWSGSFCCHIHITSSFSHPITIPLSSSFPFSSFTIHLSPPFNDMYAYLKISPNAGLRPYVTSEPHRLPEQAVSFLE